MLDGFSFYTGGIDGNGIQVGKQFAEIAAISAYSFVVSCALLYILNYIPGMHLRISDEAEMMGLDLDQFFAEQVGDWSVFDELTSRDFQASITSPGTPPVQEVSAGSSINEAVKKA